MKCLLVCVALAMFAYVSANPVYGHGGGYGRDIYGHGRGGYGGRLAYESLSGGYGHRRPVAAYGNNPRASASSAAAASALNGGSYKQLAIPAWDLDTSYNGHGYGRGIGYGHGPSIGY